jgi:mitochondrial GTPase 1
VPIINTNENKIFLVDSPGVMSPHIDNNETALKLSLIGCIKEVIAEKEPILEYMVYALNK